MYSLSKIIRRIGHIGAFAFAITTARAVDPPPDGGYPNFNTAEGEDALFSLTTGSYNTAIGFHALYSNTTQENNTAIGYNALSSNNGNFAGFDNTAIGSEALFGNTTGDYNTATGFQALLNNTGNYNTANGAFALSSNTIGSYNTATGQSALVANTIGSNNTAIGNSALESNTSGNNNTATGFGALQDNTAGRDNTATGIAALGTNQTGNFNTAVGRRALLHNKGSNNIALGTAAGLNLNRGDNNIDIGSAGVALDRNTIRIGDPAVQSITLIAGISGVTVAEGVEVIIDTNGHLGTVVSSERFKDGIKPMEKTSEAILALKPVTFRYKQKLDPKGIPQFGLVAEQVEKVNPDLVARDEQGKPYTVRYEAVNAMLLNEFLKEHRKVADQSVQIAALQRAVAGLTSTMREQAAQISGMNAQLATNRSASLLAGSDQ